MTFLDSVFPSSVESFFADFLYLKFVVAFVGVFLTAGLTFWCIQKIADFIIGAVLISAFLVVCYGLTSGSISTWGELVGASIALGIVASIVCIPILPLSSSVGSEMRKAVKAEQDGSLDQPMPLEEI